MEIVNNDSDKLNIDISALSLNNCFICKNYKAFILVYRREAAQARQRQDAFPQDCQRE